MKYICNLYEIFIIYAFSLYYVVREFLSAILNKYENRGLSGKLFMTCEGRTAIITGGTSGIGLETAKKLLSFGMNVIIGSNSSADESEYCVQSLRTQFPRSKVEVWYVDMSSMDSVKAFCERYLVSGMPLHILINNAGIMFAPYEQTVDGFESHMAVNYLSHCLLTKLLLPQLRQSSVSNCCTRIVNVSSCLHYLANVDYPTFKPSETYCPHQSYMRSKFFQVVFTLSLNKFLSSSGCSVVTNVLHPGVCYSSNLYKHVWWASYLLPFVLQKPIKGAEVSVFSALSVDLEQLGGKYIETFEIAEPNKEAEDAALQTRLWNETWAALRPWLDEVDDELKIE